MSTVNPRITVTLTPATHALLKTMSALTSNSQSSIVAQILEGSQPVFERCISLLQAAHAASESISEDVRGRMLTAHQTLESQLGLALDSMDEGVRPLLDAAEAIHRRKAGKRGPRLRGSLPPPPVRPTPMSNRGVTPHPTEGSKTQTSSARRKSKAA